MNKIPFNLPFLIGSEFDYMREAIKNQHISGGGPFSSKCERLLERTLKVKRTLLTTSCTDALEMAALLLNLKPDDEVIVPSFTFPSTAAAFALRRAKIVFADIDPRTLNVDCRKIPQLITKRTRAIVVVHYNGIPCHMKPLMELAKIHRISIIEDAAHSAFVKNGRKYLGTFGDCSTLSFHETKTFTCGEGGALLINNEALIERAEILREKGTDRAKFYRHEVDKYTWVDLGSSFLPSDLLAAFLLAQLEARREIMMRREYLWSLYHKNLWDWAKDRSIQLPYCSEAAPSAHHLYYLLLPTPQLRQKLTAHLKSKKIAALFHYQPLHLSKMGKRVGILKHDCPVSTWASERLLRLPLYNGMRSDEIRRVIDGVLSFQDFGSAKSSRTPSGHIRGQSYPPTSKTGELLRF